jgi:hypothetical protein
MKAWSSLLVVVLCAGVALALGSAGSSAPAPMCGGKRATMVGTKGFDFINGSMGPDVIVGLGNEDRINGRGGADII